MLDALIGAMILVVGAVAYYSLVPVTAKSEAMARQHTIAVQIGNRMVEQLLLLKPANVTYSGLQGLALIDASPTASPYSFTNFPMDDGWDMSPAKGLPGGTGAMTVSDAGNGSVMVKLVISWTSSGVAQSYTTGTVIGGYR
jgi:Tfp pilus assembly protein PilV